MIGIDFVYRIFGFVVAVVAVLTALDRSHPHRIRTTLFWGAYATNLLFGSLLPPFLNGCLVIVLVVVAATGGVTRGTGSATTTPEQRRASAARLRNRLFAPALVVPGLTLIATLLLKDARIGGRPLLDPKNGSLVALGLSAVIALVFALVLFRQPARAPAHEARRLLDLVGWAAILPQILAALGAIFAAAGVGNRIAEVLGRVIPLDRPFVAVVTYTVGMALFTIVMGNAFAAFPVMTAAVGLPLLVRKFGGDPAAMAAIGMLSGFCGTLMTPMAANFNIVPAALLELPDRNGVIRVQIPTALVLLAGNTLLMYILIFWR